MTKIKLEGPLSLLLGPTDHVLKPGVVLTSNGTRQA